MGSKIKIVNDVTSGGNNQERGDFMGKIFDTGHEEEGKIPFYEIPLDQITPRSVNRYRQSRIERLASSIRKTGNRLIHPITLVKASDLPKDSEILAAFEKKGVRTEELTYIIVSGERRYRAYLKLKEEEAAALSPEGTKRLGQSNPFDKITANILSSKEAKNEAVFYEDSNIEARQLTPIEAILHIKDAVNEITSPEEMRAALIEMNGGSEEGVPKSDSEVKKKFRMDKFCAFCLETDLGIEGVPEGTIRRHLSIINNCSEKVIDAIIETTYPIREASKITKFPKDIQEELLELWNNNKDEYQTKLDEINNPDLQKIKRVTRTDAKRQFKKYIEKNQKEILLLKEINEKLGEYDREIVNKGISELEELNIRAQKIIEETLSSLK